MRTLQTPVFSIWARKHKIPVWALKNAVAEIDARTEISDISKPELTALRALAKQLLKMNEDEIQQTLRCGELLEI